MEKVLNVIYEMVKSIADNESEVSVIRSDSEKGILFEVKVVKDDVGKIIGKGGRVASAIRTVAKAAGAKAGERVMVNVINTGTE